MKILSSIHGDCTDAVWKAQVKLNIIIFAHKKPTKMSAKVKILHNPMDAKQIRTSGSCVRLEINITISIGIL